MGQNSRLVKLYRVHLLGGICIILWGVNKNSTACELPGSCAYDECLVAKIAVFTCKVYLNQNKFCLYS
jgi:hypothetical protein